MTTTMSLNTLQPENVAHGTEITITCNGVVLGEIVEMDYDEDQGIERLPVLGSRRTGVRQGRYLCKGTVKAYWINNAIRTMILGDLPPVLGGVSGAPIYHSARPYQRYTIEVTGLPGSPPMTFVNVVFEKDAAKWAADKFTEESIAFTCEDIIGY